MDVFANSAALAALLLSGQAPQQQTPAAPQPVACLAVPGAGVDALMARIAPADQAVTEVFAGVGASDITDHQLTPAERALVREVLAGLPQLHRDILHHHLRRLNFLDLQPGSGSALTRVVNPGDASLQFDITLKASLLHDSLTDFLNTKEQRLFVDDGSGFSIGFDAGDSDALTYILLHETSHVVDQVLQLTASPANRFGAGIWEDPRILAMPHADSLAARTPFRRHPPVPGRHAPAYYQSLSNSPFVSFYATAAASEDLAEAFAWEQLHTSQGQRLTLTVRDSEGLPLFAYAPLETEPARRRFAQVQTFIAQYEQACRVASSRMRSGLPSADETTGGRL
ncbi:MAG: hypothetical protein B7Y88_04465 [Sphingomonadales bacterium 32-64-17]|nr:MAG: hypothetical protein B7Y88_04465 [Sphingomonadales bacterium 32-64-17]